MPAGAGKPFLLTIGIVYRCPATADWPGLCAPYFLSVQLMPAEQETLRLKAIASFYLAARNSDCTQRFPPVSRFDAILSLAS